jgi:hypothetical protein
MSKFDLVEKVLLESDEIATYYMQFGVSLSSLTEHNVNEYGTIGMGYAADLIIEEGLKMGIIEEDQI